MRLLLGRERLQRRRYNNNIYSAILFVLWARTPSGTQLSSRRGCHRVLRSNKQRRQMHENKIGLLRFRVCVIAAAASFVHFCGSAPALVLLLSLKYTAPYIHWGLFLARGPPRIVCGGKVSPPERHAPRQRNRIEPQIKYCDIRPM